MAFKLNLIIDFKLKFISFIMVPVAQCFVATYGLMSLCSIPIMVGNFGGHCWMECGFGIAFLSQCTVSLQRYVSKSYTERRIPPPPFFARSWGVGTDSGIRLCYLVPIEEDFEITEDIILGSQMGKLILKKPVSQSVLCYHLMVMKAQL